MVSETFERPIYRDLTVRGAGGRDSRPVVLMKICFGDTVYEEQFGLDNRSDMLYPVLIGRRTIAHIGLIDVSETFMHKPNCSQEQMDEERRRQQQREQEGADNETDPSGETDSQA